MKKIFAISIVASSVLANIVDTRFFYQDYLDFGQNRGVYTAGKEGILIRERNSLTYGDYSDRGMYYDVKMPDFIGSTHKYFNMSLIGGSYVGSAEHVYAAIARKQFYAPEQEYAYVTRKNVGTDRAYARYSKFITSATPAKLLEVTPNKPLDLKRFTHFWRSGSGTMHYLNSNGVSTPIESQYNKGYASTTGGAVKVTGTFQPDGRIEAISDGVYFSNMSTVSDSGSALFAWDSYEREWYVIGFLSSGDLQRYTNVTPHIWSTFESFVKENTNPIIYLQGSNTSWNGSTMNISGTNFSTTKDKDIILRGGGEIDIGSQAIDQGYGGIFFDSNQTYNITGSGSWKGAGVHIEKGTIVHWAIDGKANDGLHKVGEGTLHITRSNSGWLNLGDGLVILDTDSNAFEHYVIVSGRATLKIADGKANALKNTDKLNFSRRGGILDLNGNDLTFKKIRASDIGARITNSSSKKSTITITNENSDAYLYHGQIGDNIDILSDAVSQNNILAFDGEIYNPNGIFTHKKGGLVLQGHPYIHAYYDYDVTSTRIIVCLVKEVLNQDIYTTPTKLDQKDWENRVYILKELNTETGSTFTLGRNAILLSNLSLKGTQATFGGEAHVYIDRYDGEGANPHNSYQQRLTGGISQQDDSFFFEGNLAVAEASSLNVSNTSSNALKFGKFIGIDKNTLGLSDKPVHYTLSLDSTSSAKIRFVELYDGESIKGEQISTLSNQAISQPRTLSIEHLKIFSGKSTISGNINLSMQSYNTQATNPIAPKIIFSNLKSQIHLKDTATLNLSASTLMQIQTPNLIWEEINYNTLYPLITSESIITDNRTQKEVEFIEKPLPSFINPQTINAPQSIGVLFSRNIPKEIMKENDWLEKYASIIVSSDMSSATLEEIANFQTAISGHQKLLSSLLQTNLEGKKVYKDIYLDTLIQQACNGNISPLQSYLGGIENALKTSARYGVAILSTSLYNSTYYSYLKNIQTILANQVAFSQPLSLRQKIYLASNEIPKTPYLQTQSDYLNPPIFLQEENTKNNRLWVDIHGAFVGGEQEIFYNVGLSGGYDYALITESDEFLSLGISLHYSFAQYQEDLIQDTSHNLIGGLHAQYTISANEILFNLYAGSSIANDTNHSTIADFNTTRANNYALQAEGYYKYRFELKKDEKIYHALKPIVGVGYSYLYVPQETLGDLISISKVSSSNIFLKAGLEYNLATPQTQNIFSLTTTYNTSPAYKREIIIGTATPMDYNTEIKPLWFELSYNGSYTISQDFNLFYTLSTQFIPSSHYGISGNLGGSWSF